MARSQQSGCRVRIWNFDTMMNITGTSIRIFQHQQGIRTGISMRSLSIVTNTFPTATIVTSTEP